MVTADATWVIDPEFAFYGPMAFDIGKVRMAVKRSSVRCLAEGSHMAALRMGYCVWGGGR